MKADKNKIIVWGDGGICSQIFFYTMALYLRKKGYKIQFDLNFFKNYAKDCDGIFARNFDLKKAFPDFVIEEASDKEINYYRKHYKKNHNDVYRFQAPLFIDGYPDVMDILLKERQFFIDHFHPVDIDTCQDVLEDILKHNSCAIHVRRGDLSKNKGVYGNPCDIDYFLKAIQLLSLYEEKVKFYFFSDELDWVEKNIIPVLPQNTDYRVCNQNGSDKGYLDLYLVSKCHHIIASKGSFGAFARILSNSDGYFIGTMKSHYLSEHFDKCIFLSLKKEKQFIYTENFIKHLKLKMFLLKCIPVPFLKKKIKNKLLKEI